MTKTKKLHALNTFKPYAVCYRTGGQIEKFHFINGWGASVANHDGSYGGDEGLYELAEINPNGHIVDCLLYTSPSPRDFVRSRMPSSA